MNEPETQIVLLSKDADRLQRYAYWESDGPNMDRVGQVIHRATFDRTRVQDDTRVRLQFRRSEIEELLRRFQAHPWYFRDPIYDALFQASRRFLERGC